MWIRTVAVASLSLAPLAVADEIIGNHPGTGNTQSAQLQAGRIKAMAFTMGSQAYTLDDLVLSLNVTGTAVDFYVRIFDDNGAGAPGTEIMELVDPPILASGIADYTFTAPAPLALAAGTKYWIVVYNLGGDSLDWKGSSPSVTPTGVGATHTGNLFSASTGPNPPLSTNTSSIITTYTLNGTPDGGCYPDCDGSGSLDFFDFLCFQNEFSAGCP